MPEDQHHNYISSTNPWILDNSLKLQYSEMKSDVTYRTWERRGKEACFAREYLFWGKNVVEKRLSNDIYSSPSPAELTDKSPVLSTLIHHLIGYKGEKGVVVAMSRFIADRSEFKVL